MFIRKGYIMFTISIHFNKYKVRLQGSRNGKSKNWICSGNSKKTFKDNGIVRLPDLKTTSIRRVIHI